MNSISCSIIWSWLTSLPCNPSYLSDPAAVKFIDSLYCNMEWLPIPRPSLFLDQNLPIITFKYHFLHEAIPITQIQL